MHLSYELNNPAGYTNIEIVTVIKTVCYIEQLMGAASKPLDDKSCDTSIIDWIIDWM